MSSFVIWFGRKQVFWGERSTFPIQMNQSISALSWGLPASERGGYEAGKEPWTSSFLSSHLISFPCSSLLHSHWFALCFWSIFQSACLFLLFFITPPTLLSCGAFVIQRIEEEEEVEGREQRGEWVLLFRTDGILCLSGGQNVPARVLLMLNGTGRWIIPCIALSLDKFKGSPTTRHHRDEGVLISPFLHSRLLLFSLSFKKLSSQVHLWKSFYGLGFTCTHLHRHKQLNNLLSFTSCVNSFWNPNCKLQPSS